MRNNDYVGNFNFIKKLRNCCGLDESTRSILYTTDIRRNAKKTIDRQVSSTYYQFLNKCEGEFSIKRHGIEFSGIVGYTNVLGHSPYTHRDTEWWTHN